MSLASSVTEKRMVLAGIATVQAVAALDLVVEMVEDESLALEAQAAAVRIAKAIAADSPKEALAALKKVIAVTSNEMIKQQAQTVIDEL
jgi:enoyl-CoA hydratase/carnithine racemase